MDDGDDFGDLYADLDDHVNAGVPYPSSNEDAFKDSTTAQVSNAVDPPKVGFFREEKSRGGAGEAERTDVCGSISVVEGSPIPQQEHAGPFMAGKHADAAANSLNDACLNCCHLNYPNEMISSGSFLVKADGLLLPRNEHVDSSGNCSILSSDKSDGKDDGAIDNGEGTCPQPPKNSSTEVSKGFAQPELHEDYFRYFPTETSETCSFDHITHSRPSTHIGDTSETAVEKLEGTSCPEYLHAYPVNSNDDVSCDCDGLTGYHSAENHLGHYFGNEEHRCSRKVPHSMAECNTSLHYGHASNYVGRNRVKETGSPKKQTKKEMRGCKLQDLGRYFSGSEREASSNPNCWTDHVRRFSTSGCCEKKHINPGNYYGRKRKKHNYSPVKRSSRCNYHACPQSCLVEKGGRERNLSFGDQLKSGSMRTAFPCNEDWGPSHKLKLDAEYGIKMGATHEDGLRFKHQTVNAERRQSNVNNFKEQKTNLDVYKKDIAQRSYNSVGKGLAFGGSFRVHSDAAKHGGKEERRSVSYHDLYEQFPWERSYSSLPPDHAFRGLHSREDMIDPDSDVMVYKKYNCKDISADRRERGSDFDCQDHKWVLISNNEFPNKSDLADAAPFFRLLEAKKLYSPEVRASGRNTRCSFGHGSSVVDEKTSFQGSLHLDSRMVEQAGYFTCREQNNSLINGGAISGYPDDRKSKGSASGDLQTKYRKGSSGDKFNPEEEIHRPKYGKGNHFYPINSSNDKVEAHHSSSCSAWDSKEQLVQDPEDTDIEEGQLIEETEEICSTSKVLNLQSLKLKQNNLEEKIRDHKEGIGDSIVVKELHDSHIRETIERMKRRAERFKDPIAIKRNDAGSQKCILSQLEQQKKHAKLQSKDQPENGVGVVVFRSAVSWQSVLWYYGLKFREIP